MTKKHKLDWLDRTGLVIGRIIRLLPPTWWPHSWLVKCAQAREEKLRTWLATPPPKFGELSDAAYIAAGRREDDVFH